MRKLYGILLLTLFTINATQEQPTFFSRTRQFTVRFKEKFLRKIKQQYRDKQKRRAWLSSGAVCLVSLLSWRLVAFQKMWKRKKGMTEGNQLPKKEAVRDRLRNQPNPVQAARRALVKKGRASRAPHNDVDRSANREALLAAMEATKRLGNPPDEGTENGASNLVRFDNPPPPSSRAGQRDGTTVIKTDGEIKADEEESFGGGTCICAPGESPPDPLLNQTAKSKLVYGPNAAIDYYIEHYHVVARLKKLKKESGAAAQAKEMVARKLQNKYKLTPPIAEKVVTQAVEIIKQNIKLRKAISAGNWEDVVKLLPPGVTPKKKSKVTRLLENIARRGTLSVRELDSLNLIIWKLVHKDNTPIRKEDRAKIEGRTHSDRAPLLEMISDPTSPPS